MSSVTASSSSPSSSSTTYLSNLGLGYAIAIALGFLVLLSIVLLASYICCKTSRNRRNPNPDPNSNAISSPSDNGIIVPRIIFVAEDDDDSESNGNENVVVGLNQAVINSYPKFQYTKVNLQSGNGDSLCSICLCEYRENEMLRMMPDCRHYFHVTCVDAWLKLNASCPVCRNSPLPTPLSTPLSELVPLSRYPGGGRRSSVMIMI
ncbi:Zinc finger, RING-type [Dillenia turbinata]|uniref:Zinc finger, RING-type n=1 Tax=Dillenia turbinata TaxID=194707 RepID=A0AAN8UN79_9MAGN